MASPSPASWTSTSSRTISSCAIRRFALTSGRAIVSTSPARAGRRIDSALRSPRARGEATNTGHAGGPDRYAEVVRVLETDPFNRSRAHQIRKLDGVRAGGGQYRLRSGRWRFRYDILGQEIV